MCDGVGEGELILKRFYENITKHVMLTIPDPYHLSSRLYPTYTQKKHTECVMQIIFNRGYPLKQNIHILLVVVYQVENKIKKSKVRRGAININENYSQGFWEMSPDFLGGEGGGGGGGGWWTKKKLTIYVYGTHGT